MRKIGGKLAATLAIAGGLSFAAGGAAGLAQTPGTAFSTYSKQDSSKPIDIESDRLEVDDKQHIAIFIGNVSATQGDNNLRSQRLEVVYEKAAGGAPQPGSTKDAGTGGQQIKTITAIGGVIVKSLKDGQTATGDRAFFDVKAQKITLRADGNRNVIMTQKCSVVKGKMLTVNLNAGTYVVDEPEDGSKRRVSTVLIPGTRSAEGSAANADNCGEPKAEEKKPAAAKTKAEASSSGKPLKPTAPPAPKQAHTRPR